MSVPCRATFNAGRVTCPAGKERQHFPRGSRNDPNRVQEGTETAQKRSKTPSMPSRQPKVPPRCPRGPQEGAKRQRQSILIR
eukprot:6847915-Pyramimonas_sp.AAC.1